MWMFEFIDLVGPADAFAIMDFVIFGSIVFGAMLDEASK